MLERLDEDLKAAMLARDTLKVNVLRGLKSTLHNEEIAKGTLKDSDIVNILRKAQKQRFEAAELYRKGNAAEKADQEEKEAAIIAEYLPKALSESELETLVGQVIQEMGANGMQDMGKVMGEVTKRAEGRAEGSALAAIVRRHLS